MKFKKEKIDFKRSCISALDLTEEISIRNLIGPKTKADNIEKGIPGVYFTSTSKNESDEGNNFEDEYIQMAYDGLFSKNKIDQPIFKVELMNKKNGPAMASVILSIPINQSL